MVNLTMFEFEWSLGSMLGIYKSDNITQNTVPANLFFFVSIVCAPRRCGTKGCKTSKQLILYHTHTHMNTHNGVAMGKDVISQDE